MKKILVTGATGFIGNVLISDLIQKDYRLCAAIRSVQSVNFSTHVESILVGDISNKTDWQTALVGVDTIIHLAARAHVLEEISLNPSQEFYRTNSEGTIRLVQQAIVANVKHFIFISSIGAMTTLSNEIINEKSPCTPDTPYGISKLLAEEALINLASNSKMNWTILRPTLVYGPGNPGNMQRLFKLVDRGLPLPLGSVKNQRSLIYVGNLVDIIINCLENPRAVNESFIVSDGENISTPKLIRSISKAIQRPSRLLPVPVSWLRFIGKITGRSSSIDRLLGSLAVDNFKICHRLNWTPPYTLDQGLQATADWYLDRPSKR